MLHHNKTTVLISLHNNIHSPLQLTLRSADNATQVGRLIVHALEQLASNETTTPHREDDPVGALRYAVAVVLIYSLAMVFLIASHVRSQSHSRQGESAIIRYFKLAPKLEAKNERNCRLKLKAMVVEKLEAINGKDYKMPHRTIVV
ncbi:hypothetical protein LSAT2_026037 [Lamellibrachia satsuma]|nr:hypothetical protein LSAT2_026037 [Lamellibrachia satsuma]